MKTKPMKGCGCKNCDHSCYRTEGVSGTTHRQTSPERALQKLGVLKAMVNGEKGA